MNAITSTGSDIYGMIDDHPKLAPTTKAQYKKALRNYLATGNSLADSEALSRYAATVSSSSKAFLKSAIRLWTQAMAKGAKSQADGTTENTSRIQATLWHLENINDAIQVPATKGEKAHIWLTQAEVKRLVGLCDESLSGRRDRVVLSILLGAGLRREELANLTFDAKRQQGTRTVLEVVGKGSKSRIIPISEKLASILSEWQQIASDGFVARSVGANREIGESLSSVQIFRIVRQAGERIGKPKLAAHDLRRTFAQLGYEAGVPITQLSKLLGHSNVATTQRYLNLDLDLETTASDFIPL